MGHESAFVLANKVKKIAPAGLDHVFFVNSGSEAVETALKIALQYHRIKGEASRTRLIGRDRGRHAAESQGLVAGHGAGRGSPPPHA
jgi:beta-alanine--pyruvate transaminase